MPIQIFANDIGFLVNEGSTAGGVLSTIRVTFNMTGGWLERQENNTNIVVLNDEFLENGAIYYFRHGTPAQPASKLIIVHFIFLHLRSR